MPVDYIKLYEECILTIDFQKRKYLQDIFTIVINNQIAYKTVSSKTDVPWPIIAGIHFRESNQKFTCHLHNGDPLSARTVRVPEGRPIHGEPPFTWVDSAVDALSGLWRPSKWDLSGCLEFVERYNGLGYRKHGINTPYLWDYTSEYTSGLFVADGSFNPSATENRPGVVAILKYMDSKGLAIDAIFEPLAS